MKNVMIEALADKLRHSAGLIACVELTVSIDVVSGVRFHTILPENCNYDAIDAMCKEYLDGGLYFLYSADIFFTDGTKATMEWSWDTEEYKWRNCEASRLRYGGEVKKYTVFSCGISETFDKKTDAVEVALKLSDRVAVYDNCGRMVYMNYDVD